jgi:hypothetical protein
MLFAGRLFNEAFMFSQYLHKILLAPLQMRSLDVARVALTNSIGLASKLNIHHTRLQ